MTEINTDGILLDVHRVPGGQVDSVTRIDWCITRELVAELEQRAAKNPMMLLVVTHGLMETGRYLVPVTAERWHVKFSYPGTNTVHAAIVWDKEDGGWSTRGLLKGSKPGRYNWEVMQVFDPRLAPLEAQISQLQQQAWDIDRSLRREREKALEEPAPLPDDATPEQVQEREIRMQIILLERDIERLHGRGEDPDLELIEQLEATRASTEAEMGQLSAQLEELEANPQNQISFLDEEVSFHRSSYTAAIDVVVPADMFAKEPWKITRWLGNKWDWPYPAFDACQLRRRAWATGLMMAPLSVFAGLAWVVHAIVTAGLLFLGVRNLDFSMLRSPLLDYPNAIWYGAEASFWTHKVEKTDSDGRAVYAPRSPLYWFLNPPAIVLVVGVFTALSWWLDIRRLFFIGIAVAVALPLLAGVVQVVAAGPIRRRAAGAVERRRAAEQAMRRQMQEELQQLVCGNVKSSSGFLPNTRKVRYLATAGKALVCKPFAG